MDHNDAFRRGQYLSAVLPENDWEHHDDVHVAMEGVDGVADSGVLIALQHSTANGSTAARARLGPKRGGGHRGRVRRTCGGVRAVLSTANGSAAAAGEGNSESQIIRR